MASQSIACVRDLGIDVKKLNVNGVTIALGHPLTGTVAILLTKMVYELKRTGLKTGLISCHRKRIIRKKSVIKNS